jgi:hypothetical protein
MSTDIFIPTIVLSGVTDELQAVLRASKDTYSKDDKLLGLLPDTDIYVIREEHMIVWSMAPTEYRKAIRFAKLDVHEFKFIDNKANALSLFINYHALCSKAHIESLQTQVNDLYITRCKYEREADNLALKHRYEYQRSLSKLNQGHVLFDLVHRLEPSQQEVFKLMYALKPLDVFEPNCADSVLASDYKGYIPSTEDDLPF